MFQMLGVFSEFERAMIQSRVKAGMARIKAGAPTKSGKPVGRPTISPAVERAIREHLNVGTGMLKTARLVGVGSGTVQSPPPNGGGTPRAKAKRFPRRHGRIVAIEDRRN